VLDILLPTTAVELVVPIVDVAVGVLVCSSVPVNEAVVIAELVALLPTTAVELVVPIIVAVAALVNSTVPVNEAIVDVELVSPPIIAVVEMLVPVIVIVGERVVSWPVSVCVLIVEVVAALAVAVILL
jgi:hypothetical protein